MAGAREPKGSFLRRVTPLRRLRAWFPYTFLAAARAVAPRGAGQLSWSLRSDGGVPYFAVQAEGGGAPWRRSTIATLERQGYARRGGLAVYYPTSDRDRDDEMAWLSRIEGRTVPPDRTRRPWHRVQRNPYRDVDAALASDVAWASLALGVSRRGTKSGWGIIATVIVHVEDDGEADGSVDVQFHDDERGPWRRDAPALAALVAGLGPGFEITMVTAGFVLASRTLPARVTPREACAQVDAWFRRLAIAAVMRGP